MALGTTRPNLGLVSKFDPGDDGWGVNAFNPNFDKLDALIFLQVIAANLATPPGSPIAGDRYVVAATGTGDWTGHTDDLAIYVDSDWKFYTPEAGWRAFNADIGKYIRFDGADWILDNGASLALVDLSDVDISSPSDGDVVTWDAGSSKFIASPPSGGGSINLVDLADVNIPSPSDGDVVTWDSGTSKFISAAPSGGGGSGLFSTSIIVPTISSTGLSTWVNQSPATVADSAAGVVLTCGFSFVSSFHFIKKASPTPPYRIKALIALHSPSPNQYQGFGFGWYDGTNKLQLAKLQYENTYPSPHLIVVRQSNPTTYVSSDFTGPSVFPNPIWLMLRDDGTNVWFFWSADGVNFTTHCYMIAKASGYLGSSGYAHIAFGVDPNNQNTTATLMSYEETA